jgi:hypothetical protein
MPRQACDKLLTYDTGCAEDTYLDGPHAPKISSIAIETAPICAFYFAT